MHCRLEKKFAVSINRRRSTSSNDTTYDNDVHNNLCNDKKIKTKLRSLHRDRQLFVCVYEAADIYRCLFNNGCKGHREKKKKGHPPNT